MSGLELIPALRYVRCAGKREEDRAVHAWDRLRHLKDTQTQKEGEGENGKRQTDKFLRFP